MQTTGRVKPPHRQAFAAEASCSLVALWHLTLAGNRQGPEAKP